MEFFDADAKGGVERVTALVDPEVHDVVGTLRRRRTGECLGQRVRRDPLPSVVSDPSFPPGRLEQEL